MTYEYEGKTEKEAIEKAAQELGLERDQFDVEILETQKNSLFKKGFVKIRVHTEGNTPVAEKDYAAEPRAPRSHVANPIPQDEFEQKLIDFVTQVIQKMGYEVKVEIMFREERKTMGIMLGVISLFMATQNMYYALATLLGVVCVFSYNGELGYDKTKHPMVRTLFYAYYPVHLAVLVEARYFNEIYSNFFGKG